MYKRPTEISLQKKVFGVQDEQRYQPPQPTECLNIIQITLEFCDLCDGLFLLVTAASGSAYVHINYSTMYLPPPISSCMGNSATKA